MYDVNNLKQVIPLGNQYEAGVREVKFDVSEWREKWPGGAFSASYQHASDIAAAHDAYMVPQDCVTLDGDTLTILITKAMTKLNGYGTLNIRMVDGEHIEKRSSLLPTYVADTHDNA